MNKVDLALKLLKSPHARKLAKSPRARKLVVRAMKNEKIRKAVIKQVTKRLLPR
jgi:hypothetical protein